MTTENRYQAFSINDEGE